MTPWAVVAAIYGLVLGVASLTQPIGRRRLARVSVAAYTLVAVGAGTLADSFWVTLLVPGGLLLVGYWLSGFFFRDPQPWLEAWLLGIDRSLGAQHWMHRLPHSIRELLELSYALVYVVVGGGAIYTATFGSTALTAYWTLVLAAELASYAPLAWLRSRPPRVLEYGGYDPPGTNPSHASMFRSLNATILDNASVHANTLPSGHVSGAVAAALGVMAVNPAAGWWLIVAAGLIAVGAVAGRYHYVVDCVAGFIVALLLYGILR